MDGGDSILLSRFEIIISRHLFLSNCDGTAINLIIFFIVKFTKSIIINFKIILLLRVLILISEGKNIIFWRTISFSRDISSHVVNNFFPTHCRVFYLLCSKKNIWLEFTQINILLCVSHGLVSVLMQPARFQFLYPASKSGGIAIPSTIWDSNPPRLLGRQKYLPLY